MNKWVTICIVFALMVIALVLTLSLAIPKQPVEPEDNEGPTPDISEVYSLPSETITLNIGESYLINFPNIPQEYTYDIGITSSNGNCVIIDEYIFAMHEGNTEVKVKYFSQELNYISQIYNVSVVNENITFDYNIEYRDINKLHLSIVEESLFVPELLSITYDDNLMTLEDLGNGEFNIEISDTTTMSLCYDQKVYYTISLILNFDYLDYQVCIAGQPTTNIELYLVENIAHNWYNQLEVVINTELDGDFSLNTDLYSNELTVIANRLGYYNCDILYNNQVVADFIIKVIEPTVTSIEVSENISLSVNERYTLEYIISPTDYNYAVNIICEDENVVIMNDVVYATKAGIYNIVINANGYSKYIILTVTEINEPDYVFNLYDRVGYLIESDYMLSVGENYFNFYYENIDGLRITINDIDVPLTTDLLIITANKIGYYTVNIYVNHNSLFKTYNFHYNG